MKSLETIYNEWRMVKNDDYQADPNSSKKIRNNSMSSEQLKQKLGYRINGNSIVNYKLYVKGGRWYYEDYDGNTGTLQDLLKDSRLESKRKPFKAQFGSFY